MKPKEIFEICHTRYKTARGFLGGHVAALDWERPSEPYHWRPGRARAEEYVADFERIAARALRRPEWRGRLKLFRVYFVRGFEYRRAITLCGVCPATFDYWMAEVKKICGREFARAGLFPPGAYFRTREISHPPAPQDGAVAELHARANSNGRSGNQNGSQAVGRAPNPAENNGENDAGNEGANEDRGLEGFRPAEKVSVEV